MTALRSWCCPLWVQRQRATNHPHMARRRGTSQGLTSRGGGGSCCCIRASSAFLVVVIVSCLAVLAVGAGLDVGGGTPALVAAATTRARPGPEWQAPSNEEGVEDALPHGRPHRQRRLDEFLTDDPDEPTDDEFGDGSDEFGDGSDEFGDGSDGGGDYGGAGDGGADGSTSDGAVGAQGEAGGREDPTAAEGAEPDASGNSTSATGDASGQGDGSSTTGDQGTGGEDAGGQGNETSAGDVPGNTTNEEGGGGDPAPSPAAQPSPESSDGEGSEPSAPSADQPPPASAPAAETPAPTRRPSHSAHSAPDEAPAAAPHAGAPPPSTDDQIQDQGKDESYADMAKAQYDSMVHDRNVVIVASVFGALGFILLLVTAQQMIENPDGCCAKLCRCSIAFWRVVCWPCRKVCGCAKPNKRRGHAVVAGGDNDYGGYSHDLELT